VEAGFDRVMKASIVNEEGFKWVPNGMTLMWHRKIALNTRGFGPNLRIYYCMD